MDRNYQVSVLAPPAWPFVEIFLEIAELLRLSLESAGYPARLTLNELSPSATNIIVGYNFFGEAPSLSGCDCIVYQLEQLNQRDDRFNTEWMDRLRRARLIWDYSSQNIAFLKSHGFENVRHVPFGYHPALQRIPPRAEKDIDVLLYGSINERRRHVMRQLRERCRVEMAFRVYGEQRDELIARSKIVLNVHLHEGAIFEQARVSYLLNNQRFVVSEESGDMPYAAIVTAPYDALADTCLRYLAQPEEMDRLAAEAARRFREMRMQDFVTAALS